MGQGSDYGNRSQSPPDYSGNEVKRTTTDDKEPNIIGPDDTVYRYLCPLRKIGSIIGIGGDIAKQLRAETHARIRISETIPGCEERVVTIYSTSEETNSFGDEPVSAAQDALFRVHERVVAEEVPINGAFEESVQVNVRLLVPSDQIGCVIGKGGKIIQSIRTETNAQIRIFGSEHLPPCALSSDELIQITGEANVVNNALYQVAFCLHDNPSRSQQSLLSSLSIYRSGISFNSRNTGGPLVAATSLMGPYGTYKNDNGDRSSIMKEFKLCLVCPAENIGSVIGKGGATIKQIRQESGAYIVVDSAGADEDDCVITITSREMPEGSSRVIDAVMRLQARCSHKIETDSSEPMITTRLLVPSSRIGCIIGKGGAIIKEMRSNTRANIRIFSDENVPKVASSDDEMVQISGDMNAATQALLQVMQRLRANTFENEGSSSAFPLRPPHLPTEAFDGPKHARCDNRTRNPGNFQHSGGYNSQTLPSADNYRTNASPQPGGSDYGSYGVYSAGHSGGTRYGP